MKFERLKIMYSMHTWRLTIAQFRAVLCWRPNVSKFDKPMGT